MTVTKIDDADDVRIADYRNVSDPQLIARRSLFCAEGRLVVERLLASRRFKTRSVLVTGTALDSIKAALATHHDLPVFVVDQHILNAITGFNIHRGCLAMGERRPHGDWRTVVTGAESLVILERVGNADNVGSIFRNAAAFGVDAVLLGPACADPLYRKAIRTSMGAALAVPFAQADSWPEPLLELRKDAWAVVALTPCARSAVRDVAAAIGGSRTAIVVGHEGEGLTPETLAACDHHARIPMAEGVDSLNAATAAAVALYEFRGAALHAPPES